MKTVCVMTLLLSITVGSFALGWVSNHNTSPAANTEKIVYIEKPSTGKQDNINALIAWERKWCNNQTAGTDQWYAAGGHLQGMGWAELEQYLAWAQAERKAGSPPPMGSKGWDQEISNVTTEMYDRLTDGEFSRGFPKH